MFVKALSVLIGLFFLLQHIAANNCPKCGGKLRTRAVIDEDDPTLAKIFNQLVVRPKTIQKPPYKLPLFGSSFKGPCFRRTAIVKPAIIPRPIYTVQPDSKIEIGTNDTDLAAAAAAAVRMLTQLTSSSFVNPTPVKTIPEFQAIDVSKAYQQALVGAKPSVPADAVSLAIAYKIYQDSLNKKVCEDGLSYGFRKLPLEKQVPTKPSKPVVSEANLYDFNGEIVELKHVHEQTDADSLSAEAMDELVDLACGEDINGVNFALRPSLMDLGFTPAKITTSTFVDIPPIPHPFATVDSALPISESPVAAELPNAPTSTDESESSDSSESSGDSASSEVSVLPEASAPPLQSTGSSGESPIPPFGSLLTVPSFTPGDVFFKDFVNSEVTQDSSSEVVSCESQEESVKHIPILQPPCGGNLDNNLEGIRTYSRSRASSSGLSSTGRKE